jgi:hypothetical protein
MAGAEHRAGLSQLPLDPCIVKDVREGQEPITSRDKAFGSRALVPPIFEPRIKNDLVPV